MGEFEARTLVVRLFHYQDKVLEEYRRAGYSVHSPDSAGCYIPFEGEVAIAQFFLEPANAIALSSIVCRKLLFMTEVHFPFTLITMLVGERYRNSTYWNLPSTDNNRYV